MGKFVRRLVGLIVGGRESPVVDSKVGIAVGSDVVNGSTLGLTVGTQWKE